MTKPPADIVDESGSLFRMGNLLGQGGEGAVWDLPAMPKMVAKVYHSPLSPERAEKIRAMARLATPTLSRMTAWPDRILLRSGSPIGLLIPKVANGKDIHKLYSPKSRRTEFQRADWRFLIHAAANTARSFAAVHDAGHVIGDVNHGSVLVAQDATVTLVDTDSFQITTTGRQYLCDKGVETFTPPELQGKSLQGVIRSAHHDNFGLAVLIFQLLFLGRHPFAGRFSGKGDMPISRAIEEVRFPYGALASSVQMSRPPGTPELNIVGDETSKLFERAFAREGIRLGRPTAREWIQSLEGLERRTKQCGVQASHWFPTALKSCPWCDVERATGSTLFPFVFQQTSLGTAVDVMTLFKRADALRLAPEPPPHVDLRKSPTQKAENETVPTKPPLPPKPNTAAIVVGSVILLLFLAAAMPAGWEIISFIGAGMAGWSAYSFLDTRWQNKIAELSGPYHNERERFSAVVDRYERENQNQKVQYDGLQRQWERDTKLPDLDARKRTLQQLKLELDRLPQVRLKELANLEHQRRGNQLATFLDRYRIIDANIPGVGRERKLTLESYGVETANDVSSAAVGVVPGFGPKLTANVVGWRITIERRFVFDPNRGVDQSAINGVEQKMLSEKARLERQLESLARQLIRDHAVAMNARAALRGQITTVGSVYGQAKADAEHLSQKLRNLPKNLTA